jgi:hypothetical protein
MMGCQGRKGKVQHKNLFKKRKQAKAGKGEAGANHNGVCARSDVEPRSGHFLSEVQGVVLQFVAELSAGGQQVEHCQRGAHDRRGEGVGAARAICMQFV